MILISKLCGARRHHPPQQTNKPETKSSSLGPVHQDRDSLRWTRTFKMIISSGKQKSGMKWNSQISFRAGHNALEICGDPISEVGGFNKSMCITV